MDLPIFKYHPKAYDLALFVKSEAPCNCCGSVRGLIYETMYAAANIDAICPWCIADGSAAKMFAGSFSQDIERVDSERSNMLTIGADVIDELMHKTPGYVSWYGEYWLTHCNDVCEFHGDVQVNELLSFPTATTELLEKEHYYLFDSEACNSTAALNADYAPDMDLSIYKFVCRHCHFIRLHSDRC